MQCGYRMLQDPAVARFLDPSLPPPAASPCDALLRPNPAPLPDHLCAEVARATVERFAAATTVVSSRAVATLLTDWPFPLRSAARSDARVGVAVEWQTAAGRFWLLGLVTPDPDGDAWRLGDPIVQVERWQPPTERDPLVQAERALWRWYRRTLLGLRLGGGGRPRLEDEDDESGRRALVEEACKLKRKHPTLAWSLIARRLDVSESTLRRWRKHARRG